MIRIREENPLQTGWRPGFGWLVIDKPPGPSSHEVTTWTGNFFKQTAGHSGTLDPDVTGVLPVAIGKARKLLPALEGADKEYVCIARFAKPPAQKDVELVFKKFTGVITQMPPKEAAVKRQLRKRKIHSIKLLEIEGPLVLFRVSCEAGTYIRVLCEDMGKAMKNACEMLELRRTRAGPFTEDDAITMQQLAESANPNALLKPPEAGTALLKRVVIGNNAVNAVCHGAALAKSGVVALDDGIEKDSRVALFTVAGELVGTGIALMDSNSISKAGKGLVVRTDAVVMPPDFYPKKWGNA
jgi:predicted rRNA pseudouridine synthase